MKKREGESGEGRKRRRRTGRENKKEICWRGTKGKDKHEQIKTKTHQQRR